MRNRAVLVVVAIVAVLALVGVTVLAVLAMRTQPAADAPVKPDPPMAPTITDPDDIDADIPTEAVMVHLEALQQIADDNGGNRATGAPGYQASVDYVVGVLEGAGYEPELWAFEVPMEADRSEVELLGDQSRVFTAVYGNGFLDSPGGEVTGAINLVDPPSGADVGSSGCEIADFDAMPDGAVALMQRGGCDFVTKAQNAQEAGAAAAIVMADQATSTAFVMRGDGSGLTIPVVSVSHQAGSELAAAEGTAVRVLDARSTDPLVVHNVIAQTPTGDPTRVVVAGAHLDSVEEGPGISDNGSGSAALLAVAERLADEDLTHAVRFAWWGAEEIGLVGSTEYVQSLDAAGLAQIAAYLNVDMIASPNYVFGIYDGDGSGGGWGTAPPGSAEIEEVFAEYFRANQIPFEDSPFDGRSDYGPFIDVGIPSGGLFTGADETKTPEQAELYGGDAGVVLDPCYHRPCDTLTNIDEYALTVNTNALVAAIGSLATDLSAVLAASGRG